MHSALLVELATERERESLYSVCLCVCVVSGDLYKASVSGVSTSRLGLAITGRDVSQTGVAGSSSLVKQVTFTCI